MKWAPKWNRLIVKLDEVNDTTKSGVIIKPESAKDLERYGSVHGIVYAIGEGCWKDFGDGAPWAKIGQEVLFAKNAGWLLEEEGENYRIMNDEDIIGVNENG